MSFNGLVEQSYLLKLATMSVVLDKYKPVWAGAPTLEEQLTAQADALETYNRLLTDEEPSPASEFQHLDQADLDNVYSMSELQIKANSLAIKVLSSTFLTRFNNYHLMFADLSAQFRRIKQKKSVLSLWTGEKAKYFLAEKFANVENLNSRYSSQEALEVNTEQGLLTLPVLRKQKVDISSVTVANGSNGQAGNSDVQVELTNQDVKVLLQNTEEHFEYERLDTGPCRLVLGLDLQKPQIVNHITITPVDIGVPLSFDVVDIVFTSSTKQSLSIRDLLEPNDDVFVIEPSVFSSGWQCSFLPVEAVSVTITLEQTANYQIRTTSTDKRTVLRDRFPIALKSVELARVEYKQAGGINSVELPIRKNLYAIEPVAKVTPTDTKFYDYTLEVSYDGGSTWNIAGTDDANQITLIPENDGGFVWRVSLTRTPEAFNAFSAFLPADTKDNIKTILKTTSRFVSPTTVPLSGPAKNSVQVIQPKIGRRGDKTRAFRLGSSLAGTNKLRMPFNILKHGIKPSEAKVYIGGQQYYRREPGESLSGIEWSFADSHEEIIIGDMDSGTPVDLVLDSELMLLKEESDGYYHKTKLDFDPDKDNIVINYLARVPARKSVVLPRGGTTIFLSTDNVLGGTLQLVSNNGVTYTEVESRDEVYDAADHDYFVDYENGILYLAAAIANDTVRASFDYQTQHTLTSEDYDIVYRNNLPTHVRINKSALEATTVTEIVSDPNTEIIDPITGSYGIRTQIVPVGATRKKQFSNNYLIVNTVQVPTDLLSNELIPEEVDYIDGHTEFLGLTEITDEQTNATDSTNGVVSFALSARGLWYQNFDVVFSNTVVFGNKVSSSNDVTSGATGDYFIDNDGTVYVNTGIGSPLPGGIKMSYYFKDASFRPNNKFSVDYENGVLYTHTVLNQDAAITYKTASYTIDYDVAKQIPSQYLVDSHSVEIKTENLDPVNNQVKVIWELDTQPQVDSSIQQYFSPLISLIGFRFS